MSCPIRPPSAPRILYLRGRTGALRSIERTAVEARRTPCNYLLLVKRLRAPCACGALRALVTDDSGCGCRERVCTERCSRPRSGRRHPGRSQGRARRTPSSRVRKAATRQACAAADGSHMTALGRGWAAAPRRGNRGFVLERVPEPRERTLSPAAYRKSTHYGTHCSASSRWRRRCRFCAWHRGPPHCPVGLLDRWYGICLRGLGSAGSGPR